MPVFDTFRDFNAGLTGPICGGFDIQPDDDADVESVTRGLMVTGAGDVTVILKNGETLTLPALAPGVVYPIRVSRALDSGTTATGIKGLV